MRLRRGSWKDSKSSLFFTRIYYFGCVCLTGSHLRQSQPRWRCRRWRRCARCSRPSRRMGWCTTITSVTRSSWSGCSGSQAEHSQGLCRSPASASGTSGSSPPSTAGLHPVQILIANYEISLLSLLLNKSLSLECPSFSLPKLLLLLLLLLLLCYNYKSKVSFMGWVDL